MADAAVSFTRNGKNRPFSRTRKSSEPIHLGYVQTNINAGAIDLHEYAFSSMLMVLQDANGAAGTFHTLGLDAGSAVSESELL